MIMIIHQKTAFAIIFFIIFLVHNCDCQNSTGCEQTCGVGKSARSVMYPFGFSAGCKIQLNCTMLSNDTEIRIGDFQVLDITPSSISINLTAKCNRTIASIWLLFGQYYSPTSSNWFLLQNCEMPVTGCALPPSFMESRFHLTSCSSRSNVSCVSQDTTKVTSVLRYENVSRFGCKEVFSSVAITDESKMNFEVMELAWWLRGQCSCSDHATCSIVDETNGFRCSCPDGFDGDGFLEGQPCRYSKNSLMHLRVEAGIGIALGIFLFVLFLLCLLRKVIKTRKTAEQKKKLFRRNGGLQLEHYLSSSEGKVGDTNIFSRKELEKATNLFNKNRILGRGGQGTVYKGILPDGSIVAIKKAQMIDERKKKHSNHDLKMEQFINEIIILSQINHRNIVKLLGCCLEAEFPLLVYEFIPNGTLNQYLHEPENEFHLSWDMRLRIAIEVAGALSYLHSAASIPIYHRDIKSTNILLDENYHAKIADFGISRTLSLDQTHVTTIVQGTFGYLDPEFFHTHQFTDRSDVYSFGVVLVELLTGQKPISSTRTGEGKGLAAYFILSLEDDRLFEILDEQVLQCERKEEIMLVCRLAKRCLNVNGRRRPTMREVTRELERINSLNHSDSRQQCQENHEPMAYFHGFSTSTEFETVDTASLI